MEPALSLELRTLLEQTDLGLAVSDAEGRMTLLSPALQALFGVIEQPFVETELPEAFRLYDGCGERPLAVEEVPLVRARAGELVRDAIVSTRRPDGTWLYLRCNAAPLREEGDICGAIALVQDITAEQTVLRDQDALRARLVDTVNHQIRTPLTTLVGHAELLEDLADQLPSGAHRSVGAILASSEKLRGLVHDVSELVDLEGNARLAVRPTDVSALLCGLVAGLEGRSGAAGREPPMLRAELTPDVHAHVDPAKVARAVGALLENALTYAPPDTEVLVRLGVGPDELRIDVCDAGDGIRARDRERLLRPFERGDHPWQPVDGRGLGLAVARTVAQAHGGRLELRDVQPTGLHAVLVVPFRA